MKDSKRQMENYCIENNLAKKSLVTKLKKHEILELIYYEEIL